MEYRFSSDARTVFLNVPYKLVITPLTGLSLKDGKGKLRAFVRNTNTQEEVYFVDTSFYWARQENPEEFSGSYGSELEISSSSLVNGSANFICTFSNSSINWKDTAFITISNTIKGEDGFSYSIIINSSNGNTFRTDVYVDTVLSCQVLKNSQDVTASLEDYMFNWIRNTGNEQADSVWNMSSKARATKSVHITTDDCIGRTVFSCEVDLPEYIGVN